MADEITFQSLVREAFITPLRSVLIVDDQYPTWEEIFNSKISPSEEAAQGLLRRSSTKAWHNSVTAGEVLKLINEFRSQKPGFIIDIHDGVSGGIVGVSSAEETPQQLADHLHQSDLLILDYNLEGAEAGTGGDIARKIIYSVLNNQHFNLIVVHTSEDLNKTIFECLRSLMVSCASQYDDGIIESLISLDKIISEKEDEGDFDRKDIEAKIDMASYIKARHPDGGLIKALGEFMGGTGAFADLSAWADELSLNKSQKKLFFYWAINNFEIRYKEDFCNSPPLDLSWKISDGCKWLRTSRGFVCFVRKGPDNLLSELERALIDWRPTPSRLLSAKYREEINRIGAEVEDTSLRKKYAFAKFYDTILNPTNIELPEEQIKLLRRYKLIDHVSRQSEMLSFLVGDNIADFGERVYAADREAGFTFNKHYGVDLANIADKQIAIGQYNQYICCLPSKTGISTASVNDQLDSGHIFKLDGTWWVCATPACDLQPGQNTIAFKKGSDLSLRPFTAIKLHQVNNIKELTDRHINSGSYCYIEYEGSILGLGVKPPREDSSTPAIQKVDWCTFVALNGGMINNGSLELLELQLDLNEVGVKSSQKSAEIVAKLRYEYALNYIQRVGGSVSRIGLGYVS
ncbi:response regulator receiver domain [Aeromonas caviae]|uniref:response regulator receiver domain n=1 Tax=Aeromonas caviae TaxID=648 RepID=UPI002B4742D0|nr:response regulator receiver domain [Aeromonas caviae]